MTPEAVNDTSKTSTPRMMMPMRSSAKAAIQFQEMQSQRRLVAFVEGTSGTDDLLDSVEEDDTDYNEDQTNDDDDDDLAAMTEPQRPPILPFRQSSMRSSYQTRSTVTTTTATIRSQRGSNMFDSGYLMPEDMLDEEEELKRHGVEEIAAKENKAVKWSRLFFVLALLLSGSITAIVAYKVGRNNEKSAMQTQFVNEALELIDVSQQKVLRVFDVLSTLSLTITSFAHQNNSRNEGQPPGFYTLPDVEFHLGMARNASGAFMITYLPLVQESDRNAWEVYSRQNQDWILDANGLDATSAEELEPIPSVIWSYRDDSSTEAKEEGEEEQNNGERINNETMHRHLIGRFLLRSRPADCSEVSGTEDSSSSTTTATTTTTIDGRNNQQRRSLKKEKIPRVEPTGSGPYSPVWQRSPPVPINDTFIINYNMFDRPVFEKAVNFLQYTRKPAFLDVCTQTAWFGAEDPGEGDNPQTVVVQPVFAELGNPSSSIVGVVAAVMPWNIFFDDILNRGADPITLVMSNTCDEEFSYTIQGPTSQFMGEIDVHDPKYNHLMQSSIFADFANPADLPPEAGEYCIYTISVYPTQQMEDAYRTSEPTTYVTVVVSIFLFTSFAFVLYDCFVSQRQEKVVSTANQTQVLVSSLFPKEVQDQVLHAANEKKKKQQQQQSVNTNNETPTKAKKGKRFHRNHVSNSVSNSSEPQQSLPQDQDDMAYTLKHTAPIANLYPKTTIMFADIAGFTKWSSTREPTEVFTLLENLYHSFDTIANRRGVFKVETIGDCYVAVCGLPDARANHDVVMARFASDCMNKIKDVLRDLEPTLGPETLDLQLRAGLHSGAVTAGVLRGEKARFQLFGDTMNTASRMESTGEPGRIQCSQELADLLIASGKSHWLTQREDKIVAKGKGEMITYWLMIHSNSGRSSCE